VPTVKPTFYIPGVSQQFMTVSAQMCERASQPGWGAFLREGTCPEGHLSGGGALSVTALVRRGVVCPDT